MANTQGFAWQNPDAFVGKVTLSAFEPYAQGLTNSAYSSVAIPQGEAVRWDQPQPIAIKNIVLQNSLAAGVPAATSQASSGSEAYSYVQSAFIYSRQDYAANSTNIAPVVSASFGLSASLSYTGTAQTFGFSWVTDSAGGTSNLTTTSNAAGWSNFINGVRIWQMPIVTTLTAGEYWLIYAQSSSSNTSNSNVTLMSVSNAYNITYAAVTGAVLGQSTANVVMGNNQNGGILSAAPVFTTTIAISTMTNVAGRQIWFALSNA